jgi:hypothetical protein
MFHTSNFFLKNTEQETKLAVMFPMSSRTSIVSLVLIRHKHCRHRTLKFLIGQSFKNVFSRTEEGIGMKLGTYVPINVWISPYIHYSSQNCNSPLFIYSRIFELLSAFKPVF